MLKNHDAMDATDDKEAGNETKKKPDGLAKTKANENNSLGL